MRLSDVTDKKDVHDIDNELNLQYRKIKRTVRFIFTSVAMYTNSLLSKFYFVKLAKYFALFSGDVRTRFKPQKNTFPTTKN